MNFILFLSTSMVKFRRNVINKSSKIIEFKLETRMKRVKLNSVDFSDIYNIDI